MQVLYIKDSFMRKGVAMRAYCNKDVFMRNRKVFTKGEIYDVYEETIVRDFFHDNGHTGTVFIAKNDFGEKHTIGHKEGLYSTNSFFNTHFSTTPFPKEVVLADENVY